MSRLIIAVGMQRMNVNLLIYYSAECTEEHAAFASSARRPRRQVVPAMSDTFG